MTCPAKHPIYDLPCGVTGEHPADDIGLPEHWAWFDGERCRWTRPAPPAPEPTVFAAASATRPEHANDCGLWSDLRAGCTCGGEAGRT